MGDVRKKLAEDFLSHCEVARRRVKSKTPKYVTDVLDEIEQQCNKVIEETSKTSTRSSSGSRTTVELEPGMGDTGNQLSGTTSGSKPHVGGRKNVLKGSKEKEQPSSIELIHDLTKLRYPDKAIVLTDEGRETVEAIIELDVALSSSPLNVATSLGRAIEAFATLAEKRIETVIASDLPSDKVSLWLSESMQKLGRLFNAESHLATWCSRIISGERADGKQAISKFSRIHCLANASTDVLKSSKNEINEILQVLEGHKFVQHSELETLVYDLQEIAKRGCFKLTMAAQAGTLSKGTPIQLTSEKPASNGKIGRMVASKLGDTSKSARRKSVLPVKFK